jgi:hypothetical protein
VETFELADDALGRPEWQSRAFNERETGRTTYTHDAQGHMTQIEAVTYDLKTTTRFTWDAAGHVTGATVTDPFDAVATFTYNGLERELEPHRIGFERGHWYVAGLDRTRGGGRNFRVDRIDGRRITTVSIVPVAPVPDGDA